MFLPFLCVYLQEILRIVIMKEIKKMEKSNGNSGYNRFAQEPDETIMVIDGKRKVWDDQKKTFVDFTPLGNNEKPPLVYNDKMKDHLEDLMSGFTHGRAKKWSKNRTFYRFSIFDESFKIVVAPTRNINRVPQVYYDDNYAAAWVINSYYHHLDCRTTLRAIFKLCTLFGKYKTQEFLEGLAAIAKRKDIDPKKLRYDSYIRNGIWHTDFVENDEEKYNVMVDEITEAAINEFNIKQDKYGATYYVVRNMTHSLLGCLLDSNEDALSLGWYYRKK